MKKLARLVIVFAAIMAADLTYAAEGPRVRTAVSRRTATIGDRIRYTIDVSYSKGSEISFPVFKDKRMGEFEIKDSGKSSKKGWFGAMTQTAWYELAAYSVGKFFIPESQVFFTLAGSRERNSVPVKAIEVSIESVLPKNTAVTDIKDIKGPIQVRETGKKLAILGVLALLIFGAVKLYIKLSRRKPVKLPHETALEELESLKAAFLKSGEIKSYYVGISDSVRRYVERVFHLRAPEMTTEEFLGSLESSEVLTKEHKGLLKEFMNSCDLVKFAKYAPTRQEADLVLSTASKFIEETKDVHI